MRFLSVPVLIATLMIAFLSVPAMAVTVTVSGAELTITYNEPTENANNTPMTDIGWTNCYAQQIGGIVVKSADILASGPSGGLFVTCKVSVPVVAGQEIDVEAWGTSNDLSGNTSLETPKVIKRIDMLAPKPPS